MPVAARPPSSSRPWYVKVVACALADIAEASSRAPETTETNTRLRSIGLMRDLPRSARLFGLPARTPCHDQFSQALDLALLPFEPFLLALDLAPLGVDLLPLRVDLSLLLFEGVDEDDAQVIVLHALDLALVVVDHEPRLDLGHLLRAQAHVGGSAGLPVEGDRPQSVEQRHPGPERPEVLLVAQAR